jgi:hypothetical protein
VTARSLVERQLCVCCTEPAGWASSRQPATALHHVGWCGTAGAAKRALDHLAGQASERTEPRMDPGKLRLANHCWDTLFADRRAASSPLLWSNRRGRARTRSHSPGRRYSARPLAWRSIRHEKPSRVRPSQVDEKGCSPAPAFIGQSFRRVPQIRPILGSFTTRPAVLDTC